MTYLRPVLPILILLILIGYSRRKSILWKRIGMLACAGLFLWAWPPVAWLMAGTLEWHYKPVLPPGDGAGAIVVLSGSVYPGQPPQKEPFPGLETFLRCRYGAWLHTHWRPLPVVAAGGSTGWGIFSVIMRPVLESHGVPAGMIATEERSTSTYENALYTAELLKPRGVRHVVLVTDAIHMLRSEKSFVKQGLTVSPAPSSFHALPFDRALANFLPSARAILTNDNVLHEWIGLIWYKVSGKI